VASYLELSFELGTLAAETAETACFACGALAVTFTESRDDPVLEPAPGEVRLWPQTRLVALFGEPVDEEQTAALCAALRTTLALAPGALRLESVADRPWEREWLKDFRARRFGERLWICPHHEQVADPDAIVIKLDPGLAFGTGTHASTALCLEWLAHAHLHAPGAEPRVQDTPHSPAHESCACVGADIIDYGCGSGVLALACALLGARSVHCFDIDPQALTATRDNALANGVEGRVHVHESAATLPQGVDLLLSNILGGTLCELAPAFAARVRGGGHVVLAGLLEAEADDVTAAYAPWFDVFRFDSRDGWLCLQGRRH
jgi:ribosomal protein L11 methyltransferase